MGKFVRSFAAVGLCAALAAADASAAKVTLNYDEPIGMASCQFFLRTPLSHAVVAMSDNLDAMNNRTGLNLTFDIPDSVVILNQLKSVEVFGTCKNLAGAESAESNVLLANVPVLAPTAPKINSCELKLVSTNLTVTCGAAQ